jgi:hypothetical protein
MPQKFLDVRKERSRLERHKANKNPFKSIENGLQCFALIACMHAPARLTSKEMWNK